MLLAAIALAASFALFGILTCAIAVAVAKSDAPQGRWHHVVALVVGGVLVQVIAQLVGTGLGLLIRWPFLAMIGTIVLPLGLFLLLGTVGTTVSARAWLTPYASAPTLLSGQPNLMT